ncbi:MAG: hypothetical protein KAR42_15020 [candidate division Zixibacteria bacterium]|nr:hypothetical protein [candidate division Zixibacteria bacterium]
MACITSSTRTRISASIAAKEAVLVSLYAAYSAAATEIEEYRFDSGEGNQRVTYRNLNEIKTNIDALESEIDSLYRRLAGKGVINMNLRRKHGAY